MVEFTLPKNSRVTEGKTWPQPAGATERHGVPRLSLGSGRRKNPRIDTYFVDLDDCGADGSRRADLDQEQDRPDADLPPLLPRRRLRLLLDEHRRRQHARLHQGHGRDQRARCRSIRCRICRWSRTSCPTSRSFYAQHASIEPWLQTVTPTPREGMAAEPRRPQQARRPLRVHPVRLLLDVVPELLVERRPLSRPGRAAAGLSLADRLPRRGDRRAARRARGPVPALSLPHHHELRQGLPEGPQSRQGDRRDQEA